MDFPGWSFGHRYDFNKLSSYDTLLKRQSFDEGLPCTPNLPSPSSSPPLSKFRANALTRQKRSTNLRAFERHLGPFFEEHGIFYHSNDSWINFEVDFNQKVPEFGNMSRCGKKAVKSRDLNLLEGAHTKFTIEHQCTSGCRCECSTPSSWSQPSEVDVGTRHRRCTPLKRGPRNALRPQLSLPLRLPNVTNGAEEELAGAVGSGLVRRKSRTCRDEETLSTSLTASEGGGEQLAAGSEQRPPAEAAGSAECIPDFGALSDGLILPETNASRDMKIFKRVLRDPKLRQPFQLFLEQQFCAENLNFYVAVEKFRDMQFNNESKASERANFARHIYERHFAANSTEPVNVDNSTSKRIRETMQGGKYPRNTFDLAQYQIFHLLKYDCWPRFLRAGGVQPEFSDEELAEEDERQHRLDIGEDLPEGHAMRSASEGERQPCTSLSVWSERKKFTDKEKLRSLLWHGFDRFSRKLRREPAARSTGGSPVAPRSGHHTVRRTSSSRAADEPRRSYSSEENDLMQQPSTASAQRLVGSVGSKRRHMFATAGKQFSMPAEVGIALHM